VEGCQVKNCPGGLGISTSSSCLVRNNVVDACGGGIRVNSQSLVTDNVAKSSIGSDDGFYTSGSHSRIERNAAHLNGGNGFSAASGTTNFVVQNIAYGNTNGNYSFSGAVSVGPIMTTVGIATNHPWANFSF
jgi:hypothetical protein